MTKKQTEAEEVVTIYKSFYAEATAEVLSDPESLMDWLYGECHKRHGAQWPSMVDCTAEDFNDTPTHKLVSLMFDLGQKPHITQAARDAILNRYMDQQSVRERIEFRAMVLEQQDAEDKRQDRAEIREQFMRVMDWGPAAMPVGSEA